MSLTIVDYDAGNPTSVRRALSAIGVESVISRDPEVVRRADRVVFPGVGHAASTMRVLRERGLDEALREAYGRSVPLLGVCIGAQLVLSHSEEGDTDCLGLLRGQVRRFPELAAPLKVPHMGWNRVRLLRPHPVLAPLPEQNELYFVHSYFLDPQQEEQVLATSHHGVEFACAFASNSLVGVQFHPEKSGPLGLALLAAFAEWRPAC